MSPVSLLDSQPSGSIPRHTRLPRSVTPAFHPFAKPAMLYAWPLGSAELDLEFQSFNAAYVESLCAGDRQTQEHFVAYFTELLQLKLRSRLQSPQAIEDVSQETFARVLSVLRKDGGLRQPDRLGAFVNTVCNHVLSEHYRSSGSNNESLDVEGRPELPATGASALDIVSSRQIKQKVREILVNLPVRDRSLLKAVFLDERDRDEVCEEFQVDREYLRVLLHRAKQEFKTEYVKRIGSQSAPRVFAKKA
jgi:RNA polymerase sigma-70 factor, ECF subfamily